MILFCVELIVLAFVGGMLLFVFADWVEAKVRHLKKW